MLLGMALSLPTCIILLCFHVYASVEKCSKEVFAGVEELFLRLHLLEEHIALRKPGKPGRELYVLETLRHGHVHYPLCISGRILLHVSDA